MTKTLEHSPETLAAWDQHLADGWPYTEVAKTYGVSAPHVAKHFPGRGMSRSEYSKLGAATVRANGARVTWTKPFNQT